MAKLPDTSELDQADRHELDDAVLELLGVRTRGERDDWMARIYGYLAEHFEQTRRKEEKAIGNKKHTARRGAVRPGELAAQLWEQIGSEHPHLLRRYDPDFLDRNQPFDTYDVPTEGTPDQQSTLFMPHGVAFTRGAATVATVPTQAKEQAQLLVLLAEFGVRGLVRVPHESAECNHVRDRYQTFLQSREAQLRRLIEERTSDPEMQEKVIALLDQKLLAAV